jgi:hypothetical protein
MHLLNEQKRQQVSDMRKNMRDNIIFKKSENLDNKRVGSLTIYYSDN